METILFVSTLIALVGAYLNSIGKREGFILWIFSNLVFGIHNWMIGEWQQSILFLFYLVISINGLYNSYKLKYENKTKSAIGN